MKNRFEAPRAEDLVELGVVVEPSDEPGVISVSAWASDSDFVTVSWDEVAGSVSVRWMGGGTARVTIERELVSVVSVGRHDTSVEFRIRSSWGGLGGQLVVTVGEHISVTDTVLRAWDA